MTSLPLHAMTSQLPHRHFSNKDNAPTLWSGQHGGATLMSKPSESAWHCNSCSPPVRSRFCLSSPEGMLIDHGWKPVSSDEEIFTQDVNQALQFVSLDNAAMHAQRILHLYPGLQVSEHHFIWNSDGNWEHIS